MRIGEALFSPVPSRRSRSPTSGRQNVLTVDSPGIVFGGGGVNKDTAQKLSAVYAVVDIRSDDMSVLPAYVLNTKTKERVDHPILWLLNVRPNPMMTPSIRKKLLERSILLTGAAYDWVIRDPVSRDPVELIPLTGDLVQIQVDRFRRISYLVRDPWTNETFTLSQADVVPYLGPTNDGIHGLSFLSYAAQTVQAGLAAQEYNKTFYESGGQPAGILTVEGDLSGFVRDANGNPTETTQKDAIRKEWERVHSGAANAHKIAVLDYGMKYQALSISQKDAMFIEQQTQTIEDIARYGGVPLYKLQAGKQSYNSNEQNAIEYMGRLQPRVTQMEEAQTWGLLQLSDIDAGLEIRYNMNAMLRSDSASRANYYQSMWQTGAYSINHILELEDLPPVEGGDEHAISLNYVPLSLWRELSIKRNSGSAGGEKK